MNLTSLDPRINRLHIPENWEGNLAKNQLDQLQTFEVFHQKKENAPYQYVGPIHAPDAEVAFLYAKEQYSRRAQCTGIWLAPTLAIQVTLYVGDSESVYQFLKDDAGEARGAIQEFEIFQLKKRGKAHTHTGRVTATNYEQALQEAKKIYGSQTPVVNIWIVPVAELLRSEENDKIMWETTPDKKYRDAIAYKVQDKINAFKTEVAAQS